MRTIGFSSLSLNFSNIPKLCEFFYLSVVAVESSRNVFYILYHDTFGNNILNIVKAVQKMGFTVLTINFFVRSV